MLTENAVVLQYLGDRSALGETLPPIGNFRRYRVLEWVNFITTELHKAFGPLFSPDANDHVKDFHKKIIAKKLDHVERELGDRLHPARHDAHTARRDQEEQDEGRRREQADEHDPVQRERAEVQDDRREELRDRGCVELAVLGGQERQA